MKDKPLSVAADPLASVSSPDRRSPSLDAVRQAYGTRSTEYAELFGSAEKASAEDRAVITSWASTLAGPVLDAGCGPGHWSAFLHSLELQVEGVDATAAFVQLAAQTFRQVSFRLDDLRSIELPPNSLGGVLAWFSLIHLDPSDVPQVIRHFAAALRPGGTLLVGYFSGPELRTFDHAVVTAWVWPPSRMQHLLEDAGLEVVTSTQRPQANGRMLAEITARRTAGPDNHIDRL